MKRLTNIFLLPDIIFKMTSHYKQDEENRNFIMKTLINFVESSNDVDTDGSKQNIFLHRLLRIKDRLSDEQLKDHVLALGAAAFDALAASAAYCILFLAMHPEVQRKVFNEIDQAFGSCEELTIERLSTLEYLGRVIKETMRLVPGVHAIARECADDFDLSTSCKLSKGTVISINIFGLHRRKDLWGDDAERFNPDRFAPGIFNNKSQFYIPFSAGKRNCIGERFAFAAFKIMVLKLVKSFKFSTSLKLEELKFDRLISVKLLSGHMVTAECRQPE